MNQTKNTPTVEEKLQPWIDQGEYIIGLVIIVMTWSAGWVDLLAFESFTPVLFGRYSLSFFSLFAVYSLGFILWFWLIGSLTALSWMKHFISFLQRNPLTLLPILIAQGVIFWSMIVIEWWATFTMLSVNVLTIIVVFWLFILLAKPQADVPVQLWRKIVLSLIGLVLVAEVVLQGMAFARILPFDNLSGMTIPYGRIYQSEQGFTNGMTNRYGWYAPEFSRNNDGSRIILNGDSYLSGLEVAMEDNVGQVLESLLEASPSENDTLVMTQGQLGYGSEMFLAPLLSPILWESLEPDEIVIVYQLANDFKLDSQRDSDALIVEYVRGVTPIVVVDDFDTWHINSHKIIRGHDGFNPLFTIASNSLLWNTILHMTDNVIDGRQALATDFTSDEMPFGTATILFEEPASEQAIRAFDRTALELQVYNDYMAERGITVRLVTLPYFPTEFYENYEDSNWDSTLGDYDLLLPEQILQDIAEANDIPFLGLGEWMQSNDLDTQTIQSFFFEDGTGYLTETGHDYLANAIFTCFYDEASDRLSGCQSE